MKKIGNGSLEMQNELIEPLVMDIAKLSKLMEEMANGPKEEYGKRESGERGMYEIQRLQQRRMEDVHEILPAEAN